MSVIPASRPGGVVLGCKGTLPMSFVNTRCCGGGIRPKLRPCGCLFTSGVHRLTWAGARCARHSGLACKRAWNGAERWRFLESNARIARSRHGGKCNPLGRVGFASPCNGDSSGKPGFFKASSKPPCILLGRRVSLPVLPILRERLCRGAARLRYGCHCSVRMVRGVSLDGFRIRDSRSGAFRCVARHASKVLPPGEPSAWRLGGILQGEEP